MTLSDLFGVTLPVIQAPMAGVQDAALAIAVSRAGGLGSLPCAMLDPAAMREQIAAIRDAGVTAFNVNFFCHRPPAPDAAREAAWRKALAPYYAELGVDGESGPPGRGRQPFDAAAAEVLEELRPPVVSFHFGLPEEGLLERVRGTGARILGTATTLGEARWLEEHGVDANVAQGIEAGGHRGNFLDGDSTGQALMLDLLRDIVEESDVPVVASGGIGDYTGVAEALSVGAIAVQVGTAYLLAEEATTSVVHRAALAPGLAIETAITNVFTGRAARGIVNRLMRELGPMTDAAPPFPLAAAAIAPLRAKAESMGSSDFSPLWAGRNTAVCRRAPAGDITRGLAGPAVGSLTSAPSLRLHVTLGWRTHGR
jgi:nitronate monooxygenase